MSLSPYAVDMIIDLIENKLTNMHVIDREDSRDQVILEKTLSELHALRGHNKKEKIFEFKKVRARK